ncbi:hypothetical protein EVAR_12689_1 [Eumeta japonica]|uniref:Uncharacterized protein n=1 Tax=Eumeta variegata TaxID=151549 RepID=A0A4C1UMK3_EUMVA|nr:hypothetical protein EVAR_12689_1 [Eumeta japonica]
MFEANTKFETDEKHGKPYHALPQSGPEALTTFVTALMSMSDGDASPYSPKYKLPEEAEEVKKADFRYSGVMGSFARSLLRVKENAYCCDSVNSKAAIKLTRRLTEIQKEIVEEALRNIDLVSLFTLYSQFVAYDLNFASGPDGMAQEEHSAKWRSRSFIFSVPRYPASNEWSGYKPRADYAFQGMRAQATHISRYAYPITNRHESTSHYQCEPKQISICASLASY